MSGPRGCACIYGQCLACSARTKKYDCGQGDDLASKQVDEEALRRGWVLLPDKDLSDGAKRFANWICCDCAQEIGALKRDRQWAEGIRALAAYYVEQLRASRVDREVVAVADVPLGAFASAMRTGVDQQRDPPWLQAVLKAAFEEPAA